MDTPYVHQGLGSRDALGRCSAADCKAQLHRVAFPTRSPQKMAQSPSATDFYRDEPESLSGLVLNAMKIQPCRPGFFKARSAIIESDRILTGGKNFCELWLGFAEKGLGGDAEVVNRTP
ncbi:hypothetical protein F5148DRAFT_1224593 [Russula earlei]|uniref:Uncharacterized protein n=1 Tax=Russula earlei TaxID=71964 RepID=A0ACC0U127_9AGAM|nr:hypothetical protein F5148DRAFT_1224593 [Russula earlei]